MAGPVPKGMSSMIEGKNATELVVCMVEKKEAAEKDTD
jgi:hypothetical protein